MTLKRVGNPKLAVPGYVLSGLHPEVERLIFSFEKARRRAYNMRRKRIDRLTTLRKLNREVAIPARYVSTAYDFIKPLPAHVTFGGKKVQQLRQQGKLSPEEYRLHRNRILACRGEAGQKGNLCLRIKDGQLRVTVGDGKWIWLPIFIPRKYMSMLRMAGAYTVVMKRRLDKRGYDVRIIIDATQPVRTEPKRRMTVDINSGHVDFTVADKATMKPVAFGKINCHQLLDARKGKKQILTHRLVNKVQNIAKHYGAEVFVGKLHSSYTDSRHHFNRRIQGMNQYEMRRIMRYKLPNAGINFQERPESYTSVVGRKLSVPLGLDVHKASAYAFAIKTLDYPRFQSLRNGLTVLHEFCAGEGDGIPSMGRVEGSPLTVAHQPLTGLMCSELGIPLLREATPNQGKGGWQTRPVQSSILQIKV
jgi:IS605 OrfB family transposase